MQMRLSLIGRDEKGKQQIDGLVVDSIESNGGFQLDKHAHGPQRILFEFAMGDCNAVANPGTAIFSRVRIASNTIWDDKPNCFAASSLMISSARFLLWQ